MTLQKYELLQIKGGSISASLINAFARGITTMMDLGRSLGTALIRLYKGKICNI